VRKGSQKKYFGRPRRYTRVGSELNRIGQFAPSRRALGGSVLRREKYNNAQLCCLRDLRFKFFKMST
jgi:hypothetical protein